MIVVAARDAYLRSAVRRAGRPDEDVVTDATLAQEALDFGFPRLLVCAGGMRPHAPPAHVPVLDLDSRTLERWEAERRHLELPVSRLEHTAGRLEGLVETHAIRRTWVDATMAELVRASGGELPPPLRGFGRRIMEFPAHYRNLHALSAACATTRGALKAKFRRRGLESPSVYLRWFRLLSVAHALRDPDVTVARAARRLGFTSDGNLCRTLGNVTGMTPSDLRAASGRSRLVILFAWRHLGPRRVEAWEELEGLFALRSA